MWTTKRYDEQGVKGGVNRKDREGSEEGGVGEKVTYTSAEREKKNTSN